MQQPQNKCGRTYRHKDLEFYAMNGVICLHDNRDGSYTGLTRKEFLERAEFLNSEQPVMHGHRTAAQAEAHRLQRKVIDDMVECVKEAKIQGDPFDAAFIDWFRKHRPRGPVSQTSYQGALPSEVLPLGRFTGRTADIDRTLPPPGQAPRPRRVLDARGATHGATPRKLVLPDL